MAALLSRAIGPVPVNVVVTEQHESTLEITELPIEDGSNITDHAYRKPDRVTLEVISHRAAPTYQSLKALQTSRVPFKLVTGLHMYKNMLIRSISPERNSTYSSVFKGTIELQEVIIVGTSYVQGQDGEVPSNGRAGGANSTRAVTPAKHRVSGQATRDRATGTIARGDNRTLPVPAAKQQSILHGLSN